MASNKTYIAIDLKSFYASVECVERGLNPIGMLGEAKKQANFNSVNWKNVTVAEIQRLIKNGAEVNAKNSFGWTPLMLAIFNHNPEIKRTLIGYGANTKIRNKIMDTALIRA